MTIEFERKVEFSKLLNPMSNFEEKVFPIEFRTDPLTKDMGILMEFRFKEVGKPDLSGLIAKSLEIGCPFCPGAVEKVTPKFTPEFFPDGRIKVGEAIVFPNAMPYMPYSALAVVGSQHFIGLGEFNEDTLIDAFLASQIYLKRVAECDPEAKYCVINWNYLPHSSCSQIHSHLQLLAGYFPMTYHKNLLEASQGYHRQNRTNYWSDFIAEEKRLDERYVATVGDTVWLTSFVPRSWQMDVMAVFVGKESILTLSAKDIGNFCFGLKKVFAYMDSKDYYSFNLCIYSGLAGEEQFWTQARLIQRASYPPLDICDASSMRLLLDVMGVMKRPEEVCEELKLYFD